MIDPALHDRIASGTKRIERVELDGRIFWIKRPEQLSLRMRLQKGDPQLAFAEEVAAHLALAAKGLAVAPVVSSGPDHIVTEDCGTPIRKLVRADPAWVSEVLQAAATALAELHAAGEAHGRPSLKDICWDAGRITFLDFERTGRDSDLARAQETDVLILLFSIAAEIRGSAEAMAAARDAYRIAQPDLWSGARARLQRLLPLRYLFWPVTSLFRGKKEFDAVGPFFRFVLE